MAEILVKTGYFAFPGVCVSTLGAKTALCAMMPFFASNDLQKTSVRLNAIIAINKIVEPMIGKVGAAEKLWTVY